MPFLTVRVAGVDRSAYLCAVASGEAATFEEALRERKRFSCEFLDRTGEWFPLRGQGITVEHSEISPILFGGYIKVATRRKAPGSDAIFTRCTCVSYEEIMSRRLSITRAWSGQLAGGIFNEIIDESLIDEGFSVEFEAGPNLNFEIKEPRPTVQQALDRLCEVASEGEAIYYWDASSQKHARFFRQDSYPAPWAITDSDPAILESFEASVDETNEGITNWVWIYLGQFLRDEAAESFFGDGSKRSFDLGYPAGRVSSVSVNRGSGPVEETVGIEDVDTGMQWFWSVSSSSIRQDDAETILDATDTVAVTYQGLDQRAIGPYTDDDSTNYEGTLQGDGTGIYEKMLRIEKVSTRTDADTLAQSWLDRYSQATVTFKGSTYKTGLRAGQELYIQLSKLQLDLTMLVQSVQMTDVGSGVLENEDYTLPRGRFLWTFTAIYGANRDNWKRALVGDTEETAVGGGGDVLVPPGGGGGLIIGFVVNNGTVGTNVGPILPAPRAGSLTRCITVVKSSTDAAATFTINKNGAAIFGSPITLSASLPSGTTVVTTGFTSAVAADDLFTIDVTAGASGWQFTTQLE